MKYNLLSRRTVVVAFLVLFPMILPVASSATETEKDGTRMLQNMALKQIAGESVKDSLKACLSRIPIDATTGQNMLAKQNCQQIEVDRKTMHLTF